MLLPANILYWMLVDMFCCCLFGLVSQFQGSRPSLLTTVQGLASTCLNPAMILPQAQWTKICHSNGT